VRERRETEKREETESRHRGERERDRDRDRDRDRETEMEIEKREVTIEFIKKPEHRAIQNRKPTDKHSPSRERARHKTLGGLTARRGD